MKRDMDLIREIMLLAEESDEYPIHARLLPELGRCV